MKEARGDLKLLVDTNVWLDYFLERKNKNSALGMIQRACDRYDLMTVTPTITKDVFFLTRASLKERMREEGLEVTEGYASASNAVAWSCLRTMQELALVLNMGMPEHYAAMSMSDEHPDYEDDLLLATARNNKLDYLITNDKRLLKNKVVPAVTPQEYLDLTHD